MTSSDDSITSQLAQASRVIHHNGVICYPTEAVWGLGCHPQSEQAFDRILAMKQRPIDKGVILIAANYQQLRPYVELTPDLIEQLKGIWPGFVTCLLPKSTHCPSYLTGQYDSIAVRLTANPFLQRLCQATGTALVSTSANLSGQPPANSLQEAQAMFATAVDYYIDAPLGGADKPSRIIRFVDNQAVIVRA